MYMLISREDVITQLRWGLHRKVGNFPTVCNVKKTRLIVVQEMGTFAQKLFPYLRRYKKEGKKRNSVTKEEQHDTWREFKKGIERKRV